MAVRIWRWRFLLASGAIIASLLLSACDVPTGASSAVGTAAAQYSAPSGGSGSRGSQTAAALVTYSPKGSITLTWKHETQVLTTDLTLQGMTPNSQAKAAIYNGDCNTVNFPAVHQLHDIAADPNGKVIHQTTQINGVKDGISANWVIIVTLPIPTGQSAPNINYTLDCGTVDQSSPADSDQEMTIQFGPYHAWNGNVSGNATLERDADGVLTVNLAMDNLQPNTTQAAAIQNGNCTYLDYTVYALPQLQVDNNGHATATITISHAQAIPNPSNWYVAVFANTATSGNNARIVGCGDVQPQ